jgi:hypothetical protein
MQTSGEYKIDIFKDINYSKNSVDNLNIYEFEYLDESEFAFQTLIGIKIFQSGEELSSAIIGSVYSGTGVHSTSNIIEEKRILLCCAENIFCLSIPKLELLWKTKTDLAACFEIYKYKDSYIVHGELEISRLDNNGKIIWQRSGADIFTTIDGKDGFKLTEKFITATDFENRVYKFDYDGNNITDIAQFSWLK